MGWAVFGQDGVRCSVGWAVTRWGRGSVGWAVFGQDEWGRVWGGLCL